MTDNAGLVERLSAPAYWISGSADGHEGESDAPYLAAQALTAAEAEIARLTRQAGVDDTVAQQLQGRVADLTIRLEDAEAALTETRAMLAEAVAERDGLREAMSRRREALAGDRCQCDAPMIRCDMHGCRCTRCGLPESRARSTLTKIQEAGHAG